MGAERILCAAIYVDTGRAEPTRRSHNYPKTGLVFAGWRHGDCFTTMNAWAGGLSGEEKKRIESIQEGQLRGRNQGFLTSKGRFVIRGAAAAIAHGAGQIPELKGTLWSEDLY